MLALHLPEDIERRLETLAKATGRTKSYYACEAILAHLDELEETCAVEAEYLRFRASGEKTIPLEEVERRLGLEH